MRKYIRKIAALLIAAAALMSLAAPIFAHNAPTTANAETKTGLKTIDELNGKILGVQTSVLYEDLIKDRIKDAKWQYFTMPNDMIVAMESKKISAYLIEEVGFVAQYAQHPELVCMDELAGVCEYAVVVGNNERQGRLLYEINEYIAASNENGFLAELYDYWVMNFDAETSVIRDKPEFTGENGSVTIGIEGAYEPFSFESNGEFSGFDVEFMMNFCAAYGYIPDFKSVPFEAIAPAAETGKYDFGMNIVISDEREETAILSDPYYFCNIVFVLEGIREDGGGIIAQLTDSFDKTFMRESRWKLFVEGTGTSIFITLCSLIFGTLLGFIAYLSCRHGNRFANALVEGLTWIIDGMPTILLLMILYYVVFKLTRISGMWVSIVGYTLIFACAMYDMLCVGCKAIGRGQIEASRALGYSDSQSFFKIMLPQAARHFLPIYKNEVVTLIKETAIVGYIAVLDLTKMCDLVRSRTYEAFFPLIATAIIYFVIEGVMTAAIGASEKTLDPTRRDKARILKGITAEDI